jgi:hypothetical protein
VSGEEVERSLRVLGYDCRVEDRHRLAIIIPGPGAQAYEALRVDALRIARAHGFTHVALELLPGSAGDAALRRD